MSIKGEFTFFHGLQISQTIKPLSQANQKTKMRQYVNWAWILLSLVILSSSTSNTLLKAEEKKKGRRSL